MFVMKDIMTDYDTGAVRRVRPEETEELVALYRAQIGAPGCHWNEFYPDPEETTEDVAAGLVRCIRDEKGLLAAVTMAGGDEDFDGLNVWSSGPEGFIAAARLCVRLDMWSRGYGTRLFAAALGEARGSGAAGARLLVAKDLRRAIEMYERLGFIRMGEAHMYDNDWYCYELRF